MALKFRGPQGGQAPPTLTLKSTPAFLAAGLLLLCSFSDLSRQMYPRHYRKVIKAHLARTTVERPLGGKVEQNRSLRRSTHVDAFDVA